jgi:hypothetical protein
VLLLEGLKINQKDLRLEFIGLAKQTSKLLDFNKELSQQLERVVEELNVLKKEREEKAALKSFFATYLPNTYHQTWIYALVSSNRSINPFV